MKTQIESATQPTAHTPGPWILHMGSDRKTPVAFINTRTDNTVIAVEAMAAEGRLAFEANARLIAAAPDLLAALEEMCAFHGFSPQARAAIARAKL